jgi:hypothetical protein
MPEIRLLFQRDVKAIVNAEAGANKAARRRHPAAVPNFS